MHKQTPVATPKLSAQQKWQRKMLAASRCRVCGAKRNRYAHVCDYHGRKMTRYMRLYRRRQKGQAQ